MKLRFRGAKCFKKFASKGIFLQDTSENYYLYRQVKEGNEYIGLIAAVSVEDYFDGKESHSFGPLNKTEWNNMFYKHADHHLTQFGV